MENKDHGWQCDKTLLQRNQYMLEKEIATDVSFRVGSADETRETISGHKYMLIACSEVFEAMFCGSFAESRRKKPKLITIEDIEANTFRDMLRYIYCEDDSVITFDSVFKLMYAADKYMLSRLIIACEKFLLRSLNCSNVFNILGSSIMFRRKELQYNCLKFIALDFTTILRHNIDSLRELSLETLEVILKLEAMECSEVTLYKVCVAWAKHKIKQQLSSTPKDIEIREQLGRLLYLIRFPSMSQEQFTELVSDSEILSSEEKLSIFYYMANKTNKNLPFTCDQRTLCLEQHFLCQHSALQCRKVFDETVMKASDSVVLTGFDFVLCRFSCSTDSHKIRIKISTEQEVVSDQTVNLENCSNKINLPKHVFLVKNLEYAIGINQPEKEMAPQHSAAFEHRLLQPMPTQKLVTGQTRDLGRFGQEVTFIITHSDNLPLISGIYYRAFPQNKRIL